MLSLFGSGIGRGIAIGRAYVLRNNEIETPYYHIAKGRVSKEVARFKGAIQATENQYAEMLANLPKSAPKESAAFIEAHQMMLQDPLLVNESIKIIRTEKVNAEHALQTQANNLIAVFENMQDAYLRNKKADVQHITNRVLRSLLGIVSHSLNEFNQEDLTGRIIVSKDLSPAETMFVKERKVSAFVTDLGSQISHTAIVARSLRLPAVVGLHGASNYVNDDDLLVVDGKRGIIIVNPGQEVLRQYRRLQRRIQQRDRELKTLTRKLSRTQNGNKIKLLANIEGYKDLALVKQVNAGGVGLFRTEYLFMNRKQAPSEEAQFKAYRQIVKKLNNKPIAIRTLDIGGDKQLSFNYPQKKSSESPLGLRAVRLCLKNMELFKPQLRAILRASVYGKVSILIPMVSNLDEVDQILNLVKQTKRELREQNIAYDKRIPIGGMIEVPGAAVMAQAFAKKLDFLSIGTNDLIQYTLAIDRVDDAVNYLYDPTHPAVLSLIKTVIKAGQKVGIPVSMCGEMAGNTQFTRLLLGLGLNTFSMDATYLLDVKERVLNADIPKQRGQVRQVLKSENSLEAKMALSKLNGV